MNWVAPIKDEDTLRLFGNALKEVDYKYYIMFELGVGTGLQLQDILSIKNKDVRGKKEITVEIGTKNIKNTFQIPEELQEIIRDYTEGKDPDAYLILGHSTNNKPVSREQAYRVLRAAGHRIGLSSIGAQTMRKTFAWKYYKETGDIYYLQNLFNHASPSITYRFIGEKPNMEVVLKKMTPQENERSRYLLYLNGNGKKRLNQIINTLTDIRDNFDDPMNNDSFYGKIDCLLVELETLMRNYNETK
ncbi:tyrosine-type recombinase/integrase [uncultured Eubacterium sp.]|uniref:tyrosine-type recombinase/integrase n=1 Tax=uncultured Eubacterium sp. TaxID=165185 RepID=UPI0026725431|nr:tyrosine-type recombinase/integrase [uncultured Eubacterium sp.]